MLMRWVRRGLLTLVGLALLAGIVYMFLPTPVAVDVARAVRGPLRVTVDEDGRTRIRERHIVAAPLAGRLKRIMLKAGKSVDTGRHADPVAVLEPTDPALLDARAHAEADARVRAAEKARDRAKTQFERARAGEQLCRLTLERTRRMIASRSVSEHELEDHVAKHRAAVEDLRAAEFDERIREYELELALAAVQTQPSTAVVSRNGVQPTSAGGFVNGGFEIRSPIKGTVLRVFQESETVATPGMRILEVGNPEDLEIEIDVLSSDAVKIKIGAEVHLEHWGGKDALLAKVAKVEPAGFTKISALGVEEQRVWVIADFHEDEPAEKRTKLGDAYRVEARIVVWKNDNVLKIPAGALFRKGDQWAVFVVDGGKARLQLLQVDHTNGAETEILDGLAEGEQVIVHPGDKVKDGVAVKER